MYEFEFTIPELPQTTNSHGRVHWAIKVKLAKYWKTTVLLAVGNKKPKFPLTKAKLTLTRHSSNAPDADGLVSSFKHVVDGLTIAAVIKDDSMKVIGFPIYLWNKCPRGQGKITVKIEELENEQDLRYLPLSPEK